MPTALWLFTRGRLLFDPHPWNLTGGRL